MRNSQIPNLTLYRRPLSYKNFRMLLLIYYRQAGQLTPWLTLAIANHHWQKTRNDLHHDAVLHQAALRLKLLVAVAW